MEKCAFIVASQYTNIGDKVINEELALLWGKYSNLFIDTEGVPNSFTYNILNLNGVKSFKDNVPFSFKRFSAIHFIVSKVQFRKCVISPGPFGFANSFRGFIQRLKFVSLVFLLKVKNCDLYLFGCDPVISNIYDKLLLRWMNRLGVSFYVRSKKGVADLLRLDMDRVKYIPDLSINRFRQKNLNSKQKIFSFSFREVSSQDIDLLLRNLKSVCSRAIEEGYEVICFYQVLSDYAINQKLSNEIGSDVNFIKDQVVDGSFYDDIEIVITNRLHVLLLSMMNGCKAYAWGTEDVLTKKISDVLESLELKDLDLTSLQSWDFEKVKKFDFQNVTSKLGDAKAIIDNSIDEIFSIK